MVKRFLVLGVLTIGLLTGASAQAAPILVTDTPTVIGTVIFNFSDPGATVYDIRGTATTQAFDGATPLGSGLLAGSDDPAPQNNVLYTNLVTDLMGFSFDFSTSIFTDNLWTVAVTGFPILGSDPAFASFVGADLAQLSLLSSEIIGGEQPIGLIANYSLNFIVGPEQQPAAVPEPATLGLVGTGVVMAIRRRRSKVSA